MVLGAGSNPGNNAVRCFCNEGHWTLGVDPDGVMLGLSDANKTARITTSPGSGQKSQAHITELNRLIDYYGIDFVWAQPEQEVLFLAMHRKHLHAAVCVPNFHTVKVCQDKLRCAEKLGALAPDSGSWQDMADLFKRHGNRLWMRKRVGAGSTGALIVHSLSEAEAWARAWDAPSGHWMFAEVLEGRDLSWTGVYDRGRLVISVQKERLALLGAKRSPADVASTATVQRIIYMPGWDTPMDNAIRMVDQRPHGVYMIDARGNACPRITEINAGRFGTTMDFFAACGPCLATIAMEVGTGTYDGEYGRRGEHEVGATWLRNTDCVGRLAPVEVAV